MKTYSERENRMRVGKIFSIVLAIAAFTLTSVNFAECAYLRNVPQTLKQPNGAVIQCFATGDEHYNWLHDADNFTIIQDANTGYYVYAKKGDDGNLYSSGFTFGQVDPKSVGLEKGVQLSPQKISQSARVPRDNPEMTYAPTTGTINNLVIFIRFADDPEFTDQKSMYNEWFNSSATEANSMYNYLVVL